MGSGGGKSQSATMALIACAVIAAGVWFLFSNSSSRSSPPPPDPEAKMKSLMKRVVGLESSVAEPIRRGVEYKTYSRIKSSKKPDKAFLREIVLEQITNTYKTRLKPDEFINTFQQGYKWSDYEEIFGKDWLEEMYGVADEAAEEKTTRLGEMERERAMMNEAHRTMRRAQRQMAEVERKEAELKQKYRDVTGENPPQ